MPLRAFNVLQPSLQHWVLAIKGHDPTPFPEQHCLLQWSIADLANDGL